MKKKYFSLPKEQGLYSQKHEKDSCGVGCIVQKDGEKSHYIVESGINILKNLQHRGAVGEDPKAGDGAGILTQIPDDFFHFITKEDSFTLPTIGEYGVGMVFLPPDKKSRQCCQKEIDSIIQEEQQEVIGWRKVPTNHSCLSKNLLHLEPSIYQVFIHRKTFDLETFERKLYVIRRRIEKKIAISDIFQKEFFYISSMSYKTIVYKGMFLADQIDQYYVDLQDSLFTSSIAIVHQRYSTNTFPKWGLAQPFRYIAHNGEINTLQGNINWAKSREAQLESDLFREDLQKLFPLINEGGSDSATFDQYFELLSACGRDLEHVMMMMVPEAWENDSIMPKQLRGFYEYHSTLIEPWDGPAALIFTDGQKIGGALDRNGLRPLRYVQTRDGYLIMASEVGVLDLSNKEIKEKGRLGPGKMILVDTEKGSISFDEEIKERISHQQPYFQWVEENKIHLSDLPSPAARNHPSHDQVRLQQRAFGVTYEQLHLLMKPMAETGVETTYAMGTDTPLAVLSNYTKLLYNYFKQRFAQVTNPPIDSIREESVMSLSSSIGGGYNILEESPRHCRVLRIDRPILNNAELSQLCHINHGSFRSWRISICFPYKEKTLYQAINELCQMVENAVDQGFRLIVLSDWKTNANHAPIPALLATAAVHHDLIRKNKRGKLGIIVESGEIREVHHCALLIGYGAGAVNPYLALKSITELEVMGELEGVDSQKAQENFIQAMEKGLKKIFAKMGISTLASYQGAQIFEAIGINKDVIEKYFTGTHSVIEGIDLDTIESEAIKRHERAYIEEAKQFHKLLTGGEYNWRKQGEFHAYNPETVHLLQQAAWKNDRAIYKQFSNLVNDQSKQLCTLRGLFEFKFESGKSIPIEQVEPASEIIKRFTTGAMSIGSISKEAHEDLAVAMNRLGGKSNTGEGGEDPLRFTPEPNGDLKRSKIKQVASGRFGVTSDYLVNADEIQIKVAQGAKPGEGGQLPGFKVDPYIAKLRNTIPGVTLISPPPHHDIYSIEDLSQLIFDLKNANPQADISVKLVSETGVGTVAAGVAKALADSITIAGYDGGTGASPATSIKHAGLPWEIGLAETQQTLVLNNLRGKVRLQTDGQLKTGRDVVIAALLGAEEFGFSTSVLIANGCIMMRKCHLNTCPVGIATQNPELRKKYRGKPEYVIHFLMFIAEEVREIMAQFGVKKFNDLIGQVEKLQTNVAIQHWKAKGLDFSPFFIKPTSRENILYNTSKQTHQIDHILDRQLIAKAKDALESKKSVKIISKIANVNRTACTMLGSEVSKKFGREGLPENTIFINFEGTAGQSFAAFLPKGITVHLEGDANDYVGKGLSGGNIIIILPSHLKLEAEKNMIVGNTVLYGATSGKAFFNGLAGERFAVRNSGAITVVEGVGDHGCEYMTGGVVAILGRTGKNFAAGMSGGIAYVYDKDKNFKHNCNLSMVDLEELIDSNRIQELYQMIEDHYNFTKSDRAKYILKHWSKTQKDFVIVIPRNYRKVLSRQT